MKLEKFFILIIALTFLSGCASTKTEDPTAELAPQAAEITAAAAAGTPTPTPAPAPTPTANSDEMKIVEVPKVESRSLEQTATAPAKVEIKKLTGADPEKAYGWLKHGNERFLKGFLRKDGQSKADIRRLADGQGPHSIILSCSDSRVPPEIIFDQKLGEIFVIRTAGEALDSSVIGSIEYAVEHLGTRLILTLGHTSCGAVKAAVSYLGKNQPIESPYIEKIVKDIQPRIAKTATSHTPDKNLKAEAWDNATGVARDLMERSQIISEYVTSGQLKIKSALYNIENGKVEFE